MCVFVIYLDRNILQNVCFTKMFFSVAYLFFFLMVSF